VLQPAISADNAMQVFSRHTPYLSVYSAADGEEMKPTRFVYLAPNTLDEGLEALAEHGDGAAVLAGGQSLVPMMNLRISAPPVLIDIMRIDSLDAIEQNPQATTIGAGVRMTRAARECGVELFARALEHVGHPPIRNAGTICGSVAHADPSAEIPAALLALDGEVVLQSSARGRRTLAADDFFRSYFTTAREPDEAVIAVRVPRRQQRVAFAEVNPRMGASHGEFATAAVAAAATLDAAGRVEEIALALAGVAERPIRARQAERLLRARGTGTDARTAAARAAAEECEPAADVHAGVEFRRQLVDTLVHRVLDELTTA
jgi:CO/xanthine dehydrogenase FAD-binding subunit